jgi:type I restriction enzyme S subunit
MTLLPPGWTFARLADVAQWSSGGTPKSTVASYYAGSIPWVVTGDLTDGPVMKTAQTLTMEGLQNSSAKLVPAGTVLVAMYGASIGRLGIAAMDLTTNQAIANARVNEAVSPKYLMYYLLSQKPGLVAAGKGAAQPNIGQGVLKEWPIPIAPRREQERIVSAIEEQFSRLDAALSALQNVKRNIQRMRIAVLHAAITGSLVSHEPAEGTGKAFLQEISTLRSKHLAEHPYTGSNRVPTEADVQALPKLPVGWTWATVDQLSTKVSDGVHKKPNYVPDGIPFVTVRNLTAGNDISFDDLKYITEQDHLEYCRRTKPEYGDLLVSKDGTLGTIRAIRDRRPFSIFVSVALIKPVVLEMSDYLELALSSPVVQRQMVPKGSGLQHIHIEDLRADCVPVPPLAEQRRIVEAAQLELERVEYLQQLIDRQIDRAGSLRSSILASAFSGRLVTQDENDESASTTLNRIERERQLSTSLQVRVRKPRASRRESLQE